MSELRNCPTCESPGKHLHPAMQCEGEVQPCSDPWHIPPHALTREQVEHHADQINHCEPEYIADHVEMLVGNDAALRQALAQQAQRLKELETRCNNFPIDAPMWRGVEPDDTCAECGGSGTKVYANTSTFHYGAGGQSMTLSVCDKCWGSGNKHRPWPSWKQQAQKVERVYILVDELKATLAEREARVKELEAAHFTELKERLRYTGEYRDAKRKVEQLVTDLDAARQDAARLRGILQAILNADERGQGLPFQEAMRVAYQEVKKTT